MQYGEAVEKSVLWASTDDSDTSIGGDDASYSTGYDISVCETDSHHNNKDTIEGLFQSYTAITSAHNSLKNILNTITVQAHIKYEDQLPGSPIATKINVSFVIMAPIHGSLAMAG